MHSREMQKIFAVMRKGKTTIDKITHQALVEVQERYNVKIGKYNANVSYYLFDVRV